MTSLGQSPLTVQLLRTIAVEDDQLPLLSSKKEVSVSKYALLCWVSEDAAYFGEIDTIHRPGGF